MVALTNNIPAFTFEAPGEFMFAERIGLLPDLPPTPSLKNHSDYKEFMEQLPIYHYGNSGGKVILSYF